ncbi:MAG: RNA pseudouridine synthase [Firmicutes bacterium ZCTH02-B6]|nr:MAG: RNA pseudouridine synthase [Firmicutes bacterium ZCTH02-B6]
MEHRELIVPADADGQRLDRWLAAAGVGPSRAFVQRLIDGGLVQVEGRPAAASHKLRPGQRVTVYIPPPEPAEAQPEAIPLDVVYEDEDVIVINKRQGMVVHPAAGNRAGTLVNALLAYCPDLSGIGGKERPGIVHRLDKDTSGLLVVAKNDRAHISLARQIQAREAVREYVAIVHGRVSSDRGRIDAPIGRHPVDRKRMAVVPGGRSAVTDYEVLERFPGYTCVRAKLQTGRTHQIRVHMAHIGHPVVGDPVYGPRRCPWNLNGQCLHAFRLGFRHPRTGEWMSFTAPLPPHMEKVLRDLRGGRAGPETSAAFDGRQPG